MFEAICECADPQCSLTIPLLSGDEYLAIVKDNPKTYMIHPSCGNRTGDVVVSTERYVLEAACK